MKINQARNHYREIKEIDFLLMEILSVSRAELHTNCNQTLSLSQQAQLEQWIKRYQQGEPLAYISGHQPFWNLDLKVTQDTLVPRPETEQLVEWIVKNHSRESSLTVLDLGTGTGAIALALASEFPNWAVDAVDLSEAALEVARENARLNRIERVSFYQSDWYAAILKKKCYDIIISNPPYISEYDSHLKDLQFEPKSALVAPDEGLADLSKIIHGGIHYLKNNGLIIVEHGYNQRLAVLELMREAGYIDAVSHCDLASLPRFVTARKSL